MEKDLRMTVYVKPVTEVGVYFKELFMRCHQDNFTLAHKKIARVKDLEISAHDSAYRHMQTLAITALPPTLHLYPAV